MTEDEIAKIEAANKHNIKWNIAPKSSRDVELLITALRDARDENENSRKAVEWAESALKKTHALYQNESYLRSTKIIEYSKCKERLASAEEALKQIDCGICQGSEGPCEKVKDYMSPCEVCISRAHFKKYPESHV